MNWKNIAQTVCCAGVLTLIASGAYGGAITYYSGGITLTSTNTTTTGTSDDPWLINESFNSTCCGALMFSSDQTSGPLGVGAIVGYRTGSWIEKTVLNTTSDTWFTFELELYLDSNLIVPSGDGDGLSFAQGSGLVFSSNEFSTYTRFDITRDYLNFSGGQVDPGESVTFLFAITDNGGNDPFYLKQTPNKAEVPEPASLALLGLGLAGLAVARRRKTA